MKTTTTSELSLLIPKIQGLAVRAKTMRRVLFLLMPLLFCATAAAQDLRTLENELKTRYVGKALRVNQTIDSGEVKYSGTGESLGQPAICSQPPVDVKKIKLTKNELVLTGEASRPEVLFHRGSSPLRREKAKKVTIRIAAGGEGWQLVRIERLLAEISRPARGLRMLSKIPWPEGATAPTPDSDPRIAYLLPSGPVYRAGDGVTRPKAIYTPDPEYAEPARRAHISGMGAYALVVNEDGSVSNIRLASRPIGYGLDEKSENAVSQWRFEPATIDGKPVKVDMTVETTFCLK